MKNSTFRTGLTILLTLCFAILTAAAAEDKPKVEPAKPVNGVFFTYTGHMTTVLELKDGHYRYWFESDAKRSKEPNYPLSGEYSIQDNAITLKHDEVHQKQWEFRTINGLITLWRPDALNQKIDADFDVDRLKRFGAGSILTLTDKKAETVWAERGALIK